MKKVCMALALIAVILVLPAAAYAGDSTISESGTHDLSEYGNGSVITINSGLTVTLTNTEGTIYEDMQIACGGGTALTLSGVKIDDSSNANDCPLSFNGSGNTLILEGDSVLKAGQYQPGVKAQSGTSLEISGGGTLEAAGGTNGAGIGGGNVSGGGSVTIRGGTLEAAGGTNGAGIGGGNHGGSGTITIIDGTINAQGGVCSAGIGGGSNGTVGTIAIQGGEVVSTGGDFGAGIGGGFKSAGGSIIIENGQVTAQGGDQGAGIGGGSEGSGSDIDIKGGTVIAAGGSNGAGLGGGNASTGGTITIEDGAVTAHGGENGAGIGGGSDGDGNAISIEGGTVNAAGGTYGAGIGGGENGAGGRITAAGGQIQAAGGENGAGIGGGYYGSGGLIIIEDGTISAQGGGDYGAGIGGGGYGSGGIITIKGGQTDAAGGQYGAGVGGGYCGFSGYIDNIGGVIYAQKGSGAPYDIGNGSGGSRGELEITNNAAVFLKTDTCMAPSLSDHTHEHMTITSVTDNKVYGLSANGWAPPFGVYIAPATVSYDANGGTGEVPASMTQHINTTAVLADGEGLTRNGKEVVFWNTMSNGNGTTYARGSEYTFQSYNLRLYAIYQDQIMVFAQPVNYNSIKLTWTAFPGSSGYEIRRSSSESGSFKSIKTIKGGSVLAYTDKPLVFRKTYYYKVRAYWYEGGEKMYGDYSNINSASPQLTGVTGLKVVTYSPTKAKISWNAVPGRTKYEIWARYDSDSSVPWYDAIGSTTHTHYYLSNLAPNIPHTYWIKVYRMVGKEKVYYGSYYHDDEPEPESKVIVTTILGDVTNVTAAPKSAGSIKISWSRVKGASGYGVYRWTEGGRPALIKSTARNYYIDQNLIPNTTYNYYVKAYVRVHGSRVYSNPCESVHATPYLGPVMYLKAAGYGATKIKLTWSGVSGRTGYEIYRAASADGEYTRIKSTTYTYYTDYDRIPNTAYYYKVLAYRTVNGIRYRSRELAAVAAVTATPYLGPVTNPKAARYSATKIKLTWSAVSGRTGYEIYRSTEENGVYTLIKSTTDTYYYNGYLTTGVTYYYKILAYGTAGGVRYRSQSLADAAVVSATP